MLAFAIIYRHLLTECSTTWQCIWFGTRGLQVQILSFRPFVCGVIAQLGEHLPCTQGVRGSIPLGSTILFYGGIAQLARASGSYPAGRRFKSYFRYHLCLFIFGPLAQLVRAPGS